MKITITFLLVFTNLLSAQIKGVVVDENNKPIPFVNIWIENENIGTTSEEDGSFKIDLKDENKNLVFSAIGYKKEVSKFKEKIVLEKQIYKLEDVVIQTSKQTKEIEIGDSKKIHHRQLSGDKPWIYGKLFSYETKYSETSFLKSIIFYTDSRKEKAKIKIRVYEVKDSIPTNDILYEDLIVTVKKGMRKNKIDVSKYKIMFPKNGLIVGLEWLIIDYNKYYFYYKNEITKLPEKILVSYAPDLVINYSDIENSYRFSGGKWKKNKLIFFKTKNKNPWDNKVMVPAINLVLTN
jgi:hypothetical protein